MRPFNTASPAAGTGEAVELGKKLCLAIVAAIGRVAGITVVRQLSGGDHLYAGADVPGEIESIAQGLPRQAGAVRDDRQRPLAEHRVRLSKEVGAIDSARVGDDQWRVRGQQGAQVLRLCIAKRGGREGCDGVHAMGQSCSRR